MAKKISIERAQQFLVKNKKKKELITLGEIIGNL